jgi:hypothetical protein
MHYNYCGDCNAYTPHAFEKSGGVGWELCQDTKHGMLYNIARISEYIERTKTK